MKIFRPLTSLSILALLPGCQFVLLQPAGDIAAQQRDVMIASTVLMLLIIVPVMALTALFAWRYRASNRKATYDPDWHHSTQLEVAIWAAPLAIIIALGALTWTSTHLLDPYRKLDRLGPEQPVAAAAKPLVVEVVALDWKWLFIYPELGIATVNDAAAPIGAPIEFRITASSMMNSFFIPALAGQIYAMPMMETQLNAVANDPGDYVGFSANYSGAGFSDMNFKFHGVNAADFQKWVQSAKASGAALDLATYRKLAMPSEREPVRRFATVAPGLYTAILGGCVESGRACVDHSMAGHMHHDHSSHTAE